MQSPSVALHHRRYLLGILMAGMGSVLFSGKAILVKLAFGYGTDAATLLSLRMLMALPMFWAIYWWQMRKQVMSTLSRIDYCKIFILGFLGYFLSSYLDFLGLQYISVGLERIVLYLTPTVVLLISYFVLSKKITRLQWYALVLGYLGVMVVFFQDVGSTGANAWLGMFLVFGAACAYAAYLIGSGEMVKRVGSVRLVVLASSASAILSTAQMLIQHPHSIFDQSLPIYGLSLLNASFCTVIPMLMIMVAINRIGSPLVSQASILGPVSTIFMGSAFLNEPVTAIQIAGMGLVIGAMWLLVRNDAPIKKPSDRQISDGFINTKTPTET
jgi:drug/metabolite transporter (DMT)-like permease